MRYYVRFLVGSDNVAGYGSPEGPFFSPEAACAYAAEVEERDGAESPGDAGVRGFVVEDERGRALDLLEQ